MSFYPYSRDCFWWNSFCGIEYTDEAGRLNMKPGGSGSGAYILKKHTTKTGMILVFGKTLF
jgi:hypothetical protein